MWCRASINSYELLKRSESITQKGITIERMCRTCLKDTSITDFDNLLQEIEIDCSIRSVQNFHGKSTKLIDVVRELTGLKIDANDELPHQICSDCLENVSDAYFYRIRSYNAEKFLHKIIQTIRNKSSCSSNSARLQIDYKNLQNDDDEECHENDDNYDSATEENEVIDIIKKEDDNVNNIREIEGDDEVEFSTEAPITKDDNAGKNKFIINSESTTTIQVTAPNETRTNQQQPEQPKEIPSMSAQETPYKQQWIPARKLSSTSAAIMKLILTNCNECHTNDIRFNSIKDIEEHFRKFHSHLKPFQCFECNKRFAVLSTLQSHTKIHRSDERNKICEYCQKAFIRKDNLKRHIRTHTNERPYVCTQCTKCFKQNSELRDHLFTHGHRKLFTCNVCSKSLKSRAGLYVHLKSHQGNRDHHCHYCKNRYFTLIELLSHTRRKHEKKQQTS